MKHIEVIIAKHSKFGSLIGGIMMTMIGDVEDQVFS